MKKIFILIIAIFISSISFAAGYKDIDNLDTLSIQKKRELSKLFYSKFTHDDIEHIGNLLTYLNDRYVYAIISFDTGRDIPISEENNNYLLKNRLSYDKVNYSSNYYADYGNNIKNLIETSTQIPCLGIDSKSNTLFILGLGFTPTYYKLYKKNKEHKKMALKYAPIIDNSLQIFSVPMDSSWKKAILSYRNLRAEWDHLDKTSKALLSKLEMSQKVSITDFKDIETLTITNKTDLMHWDEQLRMRLFDIPLQQLFSLTNLKIDTAKGYINDDEEKIAKVAKIFFSNSTRLIKYTTKQNTRDFYTQTTNRIKEELNENEYNELKSESQIALDWLRVPKKINIERP